MFQFCPVKIKSLPLHHSQKVLTDNAEEYKIELTLVPTSDFYQELMTNAERLISIEPERVKKEFVRILKAGIASLDEAPK
ncbi:hypothetical protein AAH994_12215 [Weeksellaceae bacterium A-14]